MLKFKQYSLLNSQTGTMGIVGRTSGSFITLVPYCLNDQVLCGKGMYYGGRKILLIGQVPTHVGIYLSWHDT